MFQDCQTREIGKLISFNNFSFYFITLLDKTLDLIKEQKDYFRPIYTI